MTALFKPVPEGRMTPSLAASYTESADKMAYRCGATGEEGQPGEDPPLLLRWPIRGHAIAGEMT